MPVAKLLIYSFGVASMCYAGRVQHANLKLPPDALAHRQLVKDVFVSAYRDWQIYANGSDEMAPLTPGRGTNSRNGWGATTIDSLSTMKIMGLDALFAEAVLNVSKVDFTRSRTKHTVSFVRRFLWNLAQTQLTAVQFETTIRYLAGMLSAYELNGMQDEILLQQSIILASKLAIAWQGDSKIPWNKLDFVQNAAIRSEVSIAGAGSNAPEFYVLAKYSQNFTYQFLAEETFRKIATNPAIFPGLAPQMINAETGEPIGDHVTWSGGSDSYFEYLIKYARLTNNADPLWSKTWALAVDSSIKHLVKTSSVGNHLYLAATRFHHTIHQSSHLACFHGGNWILGGKLLDNQTMVHLGLQLTDACVNTYTSTATGIGPESWGFIDTNNDSNLYRSYGPDLFQERYHAQHGFFIVRGGESYQLRPEVIESNFYAWRATGDPKYQLNAVKMMNAIFKYCKAPVGYAPFPHVDQPDAKFEDGYTESFFFAEVFKYLYLTFDDPDHISLDEWVFNTEAHPFRAPPPLGTYDTDRPVFLQADRPTDLVHLATYVTGNAARVLAIVLLAVIFLARWL